MAKPKTSGSFQVVAGDARMPQIGSTVAGRYKIKRLLGDSRNVAVYEAEDLRAFGIVAIKVLSPELSLDLGFANRFKRQIMQLRQLKHPNTLKFTDSGVSETGCLFVVRDYIDGVTLRDFLNSHGAVPRQRALRIVYQIARAVAEAHGKGMVHRDLTPDTILVGEFAGESDFAWVLDLGMAAAVSEDATALEGLGMGDVRYQAPEMIVGGEIGCAADVYSLGLILLELLSGKPAIQAKTSAKVMAEQLSSEPVTIPKNIQGTALETIILRATAKRTAHRIPNAAALVRDLETVADPDNTGGMKGLSSGGYTSTGLAHSRRKKAAPSGLLRFWPHITLGLVGAIIGIAAIWGGSSGPEGPAQYVTTPTPGHNQDPAAVSEQRQNDESHQVVAPAHGSADRNRNSAEVAVDPLWPESVAVRLELAVAGPRFEDPQYAVDRCRNLYAALDAQDQAFALLLNALEHGAVGAGNWTDAESDFLVISQNLVDPLVSMHRCGAANVAVERMVQLSQLFSSDGHAMVAQLREQVDRCQANLEHVVPVWSPSEYGHRVERGLASYELAGSAEHGPERDSLLLDSVQNREHALEMLQAAILAGHIGDGDIDSAKTDLANLYALVLASLDDLDIDMWARFVADAGHTHVELLPEDSATTLDQLLGERQRTTDVSEWNWTEYRGILTMAAHAAGEANRLAMMPGLDPPRTETQVANTQPDDLPVQSESQDTAAVDPEPTTDDEPQDHEPDDARVEPEPDAVEEPDEDTVEEPDQDTDEDSEPSEDQNVDAAVVVSADPVEDQTVQTADETESPEADETSEQTEPTDSDAESSEADGAAAVGLDAVVTPDQDRGPTTEDDTDDTDDTESSHPFGVDNEAASESDEDPSAEEQTSAEDETSGDTSTVGEYEERDGLRIPERWSTDSD